MQSTVFGSSISKKQKKERKSLGYHISDMESINNKLMFICRDKHLYCNMGVDNHVYRMSEKEKLMPLKCLLRYGKQQQ